MKIVVSALFAAAIVSGCAFTTVIPLKATINNPPSVTQVPVAVGIHYGPEFRTYEYSRHKLVVPVGEASVTLLDRALPMLFERIVRVSSTAPLADGGAKLAAVIEPKIEEVEFDRPPVVVSLADVTAVVGYRFTFYSPQGTPLASWKVRGVGTPSPGWFVWKTEPFSKAMDLALEDAAKKFVTGFRDVPEVRRWLQEVGVTEAR
ncbi:MAG: hypothetical protein ACRELZ_09085 [Candidatus Rokuibacteriota bacterium]